MPSLKPPSFSRSPFQQNPVSPIDTPTGLPNFHLKPVSPNGRSRPFEDPFTEQSSLPVASQYTGQWVDNRISDQLTYFSGCSPIEESPRRYTFSNRLDQWRSSLLDVCPSTSKPKEKPLPMTPHNPSSATVSPIADELVPRYMHDTGTNVIRASGNQPPLPPPPTWYGVTHEAQSGERNVSSESLQTLEKDATLKRGLRVVEQEVSPKPQIRRWPTEPQPLHNRSAFAILFTIGDVVLTAIPIAFLALCGLAAKLNGTRTENNQLGENIVKFSRLGPTIFPIVFAAVAGRTMKVIARFCAERGARLGLLEMLMASQTVWGAFESQLLLRRLGFIGAHLLILWALSPIGGQASLYLLDRSTALINTTAPLRYMDTGPTVVSRSVLIGSDTTSPMSVMNALYAASLLAPASVRNGPRDLWGNIKIPRFEMLEVQKPDPEGWKVVPPLSSPDNYTSMVGLPSVGLKQGSSVFSLESSYLTSACSKPMVRDLDDPGWLKALGLIWSNYTNLNGDSNMFSYADLDGVAREVSFFLDTQTALGNTARINGELGVVLNKTENADAAVPLTRYIVLGSRGNSNKNTVTIFNCSLIQPHVESMVDCSSGTDCVVTKMRRSLRDRRPKVFTPLDSLEITYSLFRGLPTAGGTQQAGSSSATEIFMTNTAKSPYQDERLQGDYVNLDEVPPNLLGPRLALMLNTYFQTSLGPFAFSGGLPTNLTNYGPANVTNSTSLSDEEQHLYQGALMATLSSNAINTREFDIYIVRRQWLAVFIVTSSILFLAGVAGLMLKCFTNAPDMLGYVASLTYDNPRIVLPPGGGPLDGMERARALKDLKVRIADVRGEEAIGHVALISAEPGESLQRADTGEIRKLSRSRRYL